MIRSTRSDMAVRGRLVLLSAMAALAVACGSNPAPAPPSSAPPSATPAPSVPGPQPTDECGVAVTHLAALTERLTTDLVPLRQLLVAASFDGADAATAVRRVAATLTAYAGLEQTLGDCPSTADLGPRVDGLRIRAEGMAAGSLAARITDARAHWDAAVGLLQLLPDVLALSAATKGVADGLGIDVAVASDPDGAALAGRSPPPGATWPALLAWGDTFWPAVPTHVKDLRAAVSKGKPKTVTAQAKKLLAAVTAGQAWLAANQPWPCYRSFRTLTDSAVGAYVEAADAYVRHDDANGKKLLKKADGLRSKLSALPRDRFQVRCQLDPAAPG